MNKTEKKERKDWYVGGEHITNGDNKNGMDKVQNKREFRLSTFTQPTVLCSSQSTFFQLLTPAFFLQVLELSMIGQVNSGKLHIITAWVKKLLHRCIKFSIGLIYLFTKETQTRTAEKQSLQSRKTPSSQSHCHNPCTSNTAKSVRKKNHELLLALTMANFPAQL